MADPTSDRPLRVVLAGFGLAGAVLHAPLIATTEGLELVGAVTRAPERRAALARAHPGAVAYDTLDDALAGGDVDLVVVASPNRFHVPLATAAIAAGSHVVVDKPLAVTAAEAGVVAARAEEAGVVLSVFHNRRWDDDFLTLGRVVAEGRLGALLRVESRFDRWRPALKEGAWREGGDLADGGGLLLDLGSHLADQAVQLLGPVKSVYAELDVRRQGAVVEDDVFLALEHAGGARSHLWAGMHAAHPAPRFRVLGDRAAFVSEGLDPQEEQLRAGGSPLDAGFGRRAGSSAARIFVGEEGADGEPVTMEAGRWAAFYAGVVEAIRTEGAPPVSGAEAVAVLAILDAARESAARRTVVAVG
ncbi:MAG TPA: Gfo/Idh/MocA family oxidoreductase [Baekduia sp.]|uniref:Gfo/Idh/MocA family protein n=1 Tax=Baekduia sp. TaxID=2600305 RepID=UPI002C1CCD04|nr:Gfo/Idh/MocA family oxidoreductase [Baekduia sp.]HMJ35330.1 Gfo/Idh/MocA family oxidoreductase [Baekduia sp.]